MDNRKLVASDREKEEASKILKGFFFDGNNDENTGLWLHDHLQKRLPGVEKILAADSENGANEILDEYLPRTLVYMLGSEIFEGSHGGDLRGKILDKLFEKGEYSKIFNLYRCISNHSPKEILEMKNSFNNDQKDETRKFLCELTNKRRHPWKPGGSFARRFIRQFRLADIFAGIRSEPRPERIEEAIPKADLKDLRNFQKNMKAQIVEILNDSNENRAIVTLPTGAGKTRIVVEAIVEFLNSHSMERNILWIAPSQEVCEQAVLCFKQIWEHHGKGGTLNIFRAWGDNDIPTSDEHGIVVGGIQKLVSRRDELRCLFGDDNPLSGVFIDEAHHSVAGSYAKVLDSLGMSMFPNGIKSNDKIPLIGLTATPERRIGSETNRLLAMYGEKRIFPNDEFEPVSESNAIPFDERWNNLNFMRKKLEELKYLAHAEYIPIDPGKQVLILDETESKDLDDGGELWIEKIATEPERNNNIKNEILKEAREGRKILYFGTNASQSNAMSRILEKNGFSSVCITGDTRYAARKLYVDTFNETNSNDIQIMCNYNVLSTGFDSPQIDTVIIARPTTSIVAYQQMMGRGLRGEKFGGKPGNRCRIITVKDNIKKFNYEPVELSYVEFEQGIKDADQVQ